MAKKEIYLACSYGDIEQAKKAAACLSDGGFDAVVTTCAIDTSKTIGIVLTSKTKKEKLLRENLWIEKELARSDETGLKVLPFIVYDSRKEALETIWGSGIEAIYHSVFSDEFKPLAYDLANPKEGDQELLRLLQLYYEK